MGLSEYRKKRNFQLTKEPRGESHNCTSGMLFVVQKHDASHLHYDFRLEIDGVLKSWAVPKGPSLNPDEKRLAVRVEDHPREYGSFEGIIPQNEYGAGTVLLWDSGTWEPDGDPKQDLERGRLRFVLHGAKLHGGWILVRRGGQASNEDERTWFLFKERDEFASERSVVDEEPRSVASGRDLTEIAEQHDSVWTSGDGHSKAQRISAKPRKSSTIGASAMQNNKKPKKDQQSPQSPAVRPPVSKNNDRDRIVSAANTESQTSQSERGPVSRKTALSKTRTTRKRRS